MSTTPEPELDLEQLFLPAWAKQAPDTNRYARFEGEPEGRFDRTSRGGDHRGPRPDGSSRRPGPGGGRPPGGGRAGGGRGERGSDARSGRARVEERHEPVLPFPEVDVALLPDEKGVESLARQIKLTGRAYPLFEIAFLVLKKSDRFMVRFKVIKKPDGQVAQPLLLCSLDETAWLSEQEAVDHVLRKHFDTFYQAEKSAIEPPKGTYTFVAQCGMSGVVLGPPNYHDYQTKLRKLHAERFARMPFEVFKARVKIVKDEAVVKQWLEDQSWKTEYIGLNVPETIRLPTREAVEKHFRETHLANVVRTTETYTVSGSALSSLPVGLRRLAYRDLDDQRRFPLKVVHVLSHQFARHGLQFFKNNKTVTYIAVARPRYLDLNATPVSEGVKRIIAFINATRKCTRRQLLEALSPASAAPAAEIPAPAPPAPASPPAAPAAEGSSPAPETRAEASPEAAAIVADLHWLIYEGHVIEFANGVLETAKQLPPKPPKPQPQARAATPGATEPAEGGETAAVDPTASPAEPVATTPVETTSEPVPSMEPATAPEPTPPPPVPEVQTAEPNGDVPNAT
ncbi:MAG: hypothetical protein ACYDH9_22480 [Limisphaerales bacterium]